MATYTALATITLSSSASSVTFSSIPSTYRDLVLVANATGASVEGYSTLRLNADSGSNYSYVRMIGQSSGASSQAYSSETSFSRSFYVKTSLPAMTTIQINDASATDKHKSLLWRQDYSLDTAEATAGRWASTSAVTSIALTRVSGTFNSGSTFSLFGIEA